MTDDLVYAGVSEHVFVCVNAHVGEQIMCLSCVCDGLVCESFVGRRVHTTLAPITLRIFPRLYLPP